MANPFAGPHLVGLGGEPIGAPKPMGVVVQFLVPYANIPPGTDPVAVAQQTLALFSAPVTLAIAQKTAKPLLGEEYEQLLAKLGMHLTPTAPPGPVQ